MRTSLEVPPMVLAVDRVDEHGEEINLEGSDLEEILFWLAWDKYGSACRHIDIDSPLPENEQAKFEWVGEVFDLEKDHDVWIYFVFDPKNKHHEILKELLLVQLDCDDNYQLDIWDELLSYEKKWLDTVCLARSLHRPDYIKNDFVVFSHGGDDPAGINDLWINSMGAVHLDWNNDEAVIYTFNKIDLEVPRELARIQGIRHKTEEEIDAMIVPVIKPYLDKTPYPYVEKAPEAEFPEMNM